MFILSYISKYELQTKYGQLSYYFFRRYKFFVHFMFAITKNIAEKRSVHDSPGMYKTKNVLKGKNLKSKNLKPSTDGRNILSYLLRSKIYEIQRNRIAFEAAWNRYVIFWINYKELYADS